MISVFTASHDPQYLGDCYRSLSAQTVDDWEWIVYVNAPAQIDGSLWAVPDSRVKIVRTEEIGRGVGFYKRHAVEQCTRDILVELDHDDWLLPDALEEVHKAFEQNPGAALVYSDFAYIEANGEPSSFQYGGRWNYSSEVYYGRMYHRCHAQAPTPENVAVIWYAPNHIRAFPRWAYDTVGGYDERYEVLDDLDLMTRLFVAGPFVHIDKLLYLQRKHPGNTQSHPGKNNLIQNRCAEIYRERISAMTDAYVDRLIKGRLE